MEKIFVSACLLGARVRYDGRAKTLDDTLLATWRAEGRLVVLCPEMAAGLPTPRPAAEIAPGASAENVLNGRAGIYDRDGLDLTADFTQGADLALEVAQENGCRFALLADGSPSCGSTYVHAGRFRRPAGERRGRHGCPVARGGHHGLRTTSTERTGARARDGRKYLPIGQAFVDTAPALAYCPAFIGDSAVRGAPLSALRPRLTEREPCQNVPSSPRTWFANAATGSARAWPPRPVARF